MINKTTKNRIAALFEVYRAIAGENKEALYEAAQSEIPESVYNSNAIENSTLTLEDTEDILIAMKSVEIMISVKFMKRKIWLKSWRFFMTIFKKAGIR